jgi:hypothetical protein
LPKNFTAKRALEKEKMPPRLKDLGKTRSVIEQFLQFFVKLGDFASLPALPLRQTGSWQIT